MNRRNSHLSFILLAIVLAATGPVWAVAVGTNVDIHMDIPDAVANDFHIEGRIESGEPLQNWADPPVLLHHVDGGFPSDQFSCTIVPDTSDPAQNWYIFRADWKGAEFQYCQVLHLGLLFDVTCHNAIIDLVGWWTFNGQRLSAGQNGATVPITGFEVHDLVQDQPQVMRIRNDSHLADAQIQTEIVQLEMVTMPQQELTEILGPLPEAFEQLQEGGLQSQLPWTPAQNRAGPISPENPLPIPPDSFFDVFFDVDPQPDSFFDIWVELEIPDGGFLISRQLVRFINNAGEPDFRWYWEIHEAHQTELVPTDPILRVGDWINPEPWHNWIAPGPEPTEVQLLVSDPCNLIAQVDFSLSRDGENWILFDTDTDGYEPQEDTIGDSQNAGDGWTGYLEPTQLPQEPGPLFFRAVAHWNGQILTARTDRILDMTPPDSVILNIQDWQEIPGDSLTVDVDPDLANIKDVYLELEVKPEEFKKGIPPISQQPHSSTHCAPTAAAACLKYYENNGDAQIGGGLTDHQLVDALATLAKTNKGHSGTYPSDLAKALTQWIQNNGNGYTVRGPLDFDWKEMRDELERCQDVLVGIYWTGGGGHRMTLNSIVNRPGDDGKIRVDFMDPWTGTIEYGNLDPATGQVTDFESTSGNSGELDNTIIVCPKEDQPGSGDPYPGPDPGPVVLPVPDPGLYFLRVTVVDQDLHAYTHIRVVDVLPQSRHDLGDAPDSSNSTPVAPTPMTAYPAGGPPGVVAKFPTVFALGSPPYGPLHRQPRAVAYLGSAVSLENEADIGPDQDPTNNIDPPADKPDLDLADDGVQTPLALPHCRQTRFNYDITIAPSVVNPPQLYVNVWFDFNRDGDWDDSPSCPSPDGTHLVPVPEWAVQNQLISGYTAGLHTLTTPVFTAWNPDGLNDKAIWMRITLSEQPRDPIAGTPDTGGSGPSTGYQYGETEDYYFVPTTPGPTPPSDPILRVGDWINPEPWHNWIAPSPDPLQVQLLVSDPCEAIELVQFMYSVDGQTWNLFSEDQDGREPEEDTVGAAENVGDGWSGYLLTNELPAEPRQIMFQAVAQWGGEPLVATAEREFDPTPPSSVELNVSDWQLVEEEVLQVDLDPILANIKDIFIDLVEKPEEYKKGIPPISQQPHSSTHCAPTAAAACLKYYENQGDAQIGGGLTDHQLVDALAALAKTNQGHSGTYPSDLAKALKQWIQNHGDGYTVRGPLAFNWKQMRDELERSQDVLVGIYWTGGGGHRMTMNSIVNRPKPDGKIRVDFMDPWTGTIEYGDLDPATGQVANFESTSGNSGELGNIIIVCPKEDDPGGGGGDPHPGPDPGPVDVVIKKPGLHFLRIRVVDDDLHAHTVIRVIDVQPYKPKPPTKRVKWSQPPIEIDPRTKTPVYCGWDEPSFATGSIETGSGQWRIAADDFRCIGSMPVTSIHWWGSYVGWEGLRPPQQAPVGWLVGFWDNVPADATGETPYSHPGKLLKFIQIPADRVKIEWVGMDRFPQKPNDTCFQYYVDLEKDEWFDQAIYESPEDVFWLGIVAVYPENTDPEHVWGWKTRPKHWMDDAVTFVPDITILNGNTLDPLAYKPIENDLVCGPESYDLAFELDTSPRFVKWDQPFTGIRRWPHYEDEVSMATISPDGTDEPVISRQVADDWLCSGRTPVTAAVWWGSYIGYEYRPCRCNDVPEPRKPDYFLLSIWTDIPAGVDLPYSHPGKKVWQYKAYDYDEVMVGFDKHPEDVVPGTSAGYEPVFRYSVKLPQEHWFEQKRANDVYWFSAVAVYKDAQDLPYKWGWTNHPHRPWGVPGLEPVGHWKFDEASGRIAADSSPNTNDGTLRGNPTWMPGGGMLGGAIGLSGQGDWIRTSDTTTGLNLAPGSFTASAWINARNVAGGWKTILEYDRVGTNWYGLWLNTDGRFHFRVGMDTKNSNQVLNPNEWYLLTAVYDSATNLMKLYIDGSPDSSAAHASGYTGPSDALLTMGVRGLEDDEFFDGLLDDVRIYDSALTETQVGSLLTIGRNDDAVAGLPEGSGDDVIWQWQEQFDQAGDSEDMSFTLFTEPGCFPTGHTDYLEWLKVGKPDCWCFPRQCHGDADGKLEGGGKIPLRAVGTADLNILISAWNVYEPDSPVDPGPGIGSVPSGICADFSHSVEGGGKIPLRRVGTADLNILIGSWKVYEPNSPIEPGPGVPTDCLD